MTSRIVVTAATAGALFASGAAFAQGDVGERPPGGPGVELEAVENAIELTIASGYNQGIGNINDDRALSDTSTAGGAVQAGVGYRLIPALTLGVYGSGAMFGRGDEVDNSAEIYSTTAGLQADWHFWPERQIDPWVSLGTGWRGYWVSQNAGTISLHGLQVAKLQLGTDFRFNRDLAISPVVGADASLFLTSRDPGDGGFDSIGGPKLNTFVFGGVLARFDLSLERPSAAATR